jgi:hypothetical protein
VYLLLKRGTNYLVEHLIIKWLQNYLMVKNKRLKNSLQSTILNVKQLPRFKVALKEKKQQIF